MRDQLDEEIRAEAPNLQFDRDNIYLLTDDATSRSAAAGSPMYRVLILDDDGVFQQRSGYFVPDVEGQQAKTPNRNSRTSGWRSDRQRKKVALLTDASSSKRRERHTKSARASQERLCQRRSFTQIPFYLDSRRIVAEAIQLPGEIRRK